MKTTVYLDDFRTAFHNMGRGEQFTHSGLEVLFDYLTELEHCEEEYELDVIALCCDFAEDNARSIAENYRIYYESDEALEECVRDYLDNEGVLVGETDTTLVYRQF
jgi:hypothetical protein